MDRKQFLNRCVRGFCSCTAIGVFMPISSTAAETESHEDYRFPFIKERYAKLFEILSEKLSDEELADTYKELGAFCASKGQLVQKYKGDIDGYIVEFKKLSGDDITYDRQTKIITVTGSEHSECFCPLVDQTLISEKYCQCSLGWQEYAFEKLLGKKVKAELMESILHGSKRCAFKISILDGNI